MNIFCCFFAIISSIIVVLVGYLLLPTLLSLDFGKSILLIFEALFLCSREITTEKLLLNFWLIVA